MLPAMKALNHFTKRRFKRLKRLLSHFPVGSKKEELHRIRIEIKKIKSLLRLIHYHNKDFSDHKHYKPFRTLFREAGKIRDLGLRNELLEQYTKIHLPFYRSPDQRIRQFINSLPSRRKVIGKLKKTILKNISKINSDTYNRYLRKKRIELNKNLAEGITQKDLHKLRKLIKEITYLTAVTVSKNKIDSFLIDSTELIGNWHDKQVLLPWIRKHAPEEKETIRILKTQSNQDVQQLRKLVDEI